MKIEFRIVKLNKIKWGAVLKLTSSSQVPPPMPSSKPIANLNTNNNNNEIKVTQSNAKTEESPQVKPKLIPNNETTTQHHHHQQQQQQQQQKPKTVSQTYTNKIEMDTQPHKPLPPYMGYTGFRNIGNTCYMNATLQCLVNTTDFRNFFMGMFIITCYLFTFILN